MPFVLLQHPLAPEEISSLRREFPHLEFVLIPPEREPTDEEWKDVEVLFGGRLSALDLQKAYRLRWIHVPGASLEGLCVREIEESTNLLVSNTKDPDVHQMAEFALSGMLAFGKELFEWQRMQDDPKALWESPARSLIWSFRNQTLLQVGLGKVGTAILEHAQGIGMRTWGVQESRSFHPYCQKTFGIKDLHSLLPAVEVVSIAIPRGEEASALFHEQQLELMRDDSILVVLGSEGVIDEEALARVAKRGKFRGILLDGFLEERRARKSPLWGIPNLIITPRVAICPEPAERLEFRQFQHNFRRYIHNDYDGMKNLLTPIAAYPETR